MSPAQYSVEGTAIATPMPTADLIVRKQTLKCLFGCNPAFIAKNPDGFLRHVTARHTGAVLEERHVRQLSILNKMICEGCGQIRPGQRRQCSGCKQCAPMRGTRVGDIVQDRALSVTPRAAEPNASQGSRQR